MNCVSATRIPIANRCVRNNNKKHSENCVLVFRLIYQDMTAKVKIFFFRLFVCLLVSFQHNCFRYRAINHEADFGNNSSHVDISWNIAKTSEHLFVWHLKKGTHIRGIKYGQANGVDRFCWRYQLRRHSIAFDFNDKFKKCVCPSERIVNLSAF